MNKWVTDTLADMGRTDIKVLSDNELPSTLDCMEQGMCPSSFSRQLPVR